jgi:hypothetical protein
MLPDSTVFLTGIDYDGEAPALVLGLPGESRRERFPVVGTAFTLRRMKRRFCVGRYDLATFETSACPDLASLDEDAKKIRCERCEYFCGFNPGFYRTTVDGMSPQQRAYSEQPHAVYLACFGRAAVKVGIGHERRLRTRLLEQGARAALLVAVMPDAYTARRVEERISATGVAEHLNGAAKRRLLNERFDRRAAFDELRQMHDAVTSAAPEVASTVNEPFDLSPLQIAAPDLRLPILDLSETRPLTISGRGLGVIGDTLLVEQNNAAFMMGLKPALSHVVAIELVEKKNATVTPQQAGLF